MPDKYNRYLITGSRFDEFIINIKQDVNRPNNPEDYDLIEDYMRNNYLGEKFNAIDLDYLEYFDVVDI